MSLILEITESTDIGLKLFTSLWSPSLKIGVTFACFHAEGTDDVRKERLQIYDHDKQLAQQALKV